MAEFLGQPIGFIGLGSMGMSICNRMLCAGYRVKACEIRKEAIEALQQTGASVVDTPPKAAEGVQLLVICVFTHTQAEAVLFGDAESEHNKIGAISSLPAGATVAVHTTLLPDQAAAFEKRLRKTGHLYLDAPIVGGKMADDTGGLTIVASGVDEAFDAAEDPLRQVGERFFRCGNTAGSASSVKMIDSMLTAIHTVAAAEAITFAAKCGVSPTLVHEALGHGMANSMVFQKWVPHMLADDFESPGQSGMHAVKKDLSMALEAANMFSYPMPMTALALQQFLGGSALSETRRGAPAVVKLYEKLGAINLVAAAKGKGRAKRYKVISPARLREGFEIDSEEIGMLQSGQLITVLEERVNEVGNLRVRCAGGWTSDVSRADGILLELVTDNTATLASSGSGGQIPGRSTSKGRLFKEGV
jgi:3-hydroxyisobutyrate dehydrogenase